MMNDKTLELKCMSCMPQKLSEDEYKSMCLGLIHALGISPKSMSVLTQLQCIHNRKLKFFKPSELSEEKNTSFSCLTFSEENDLEYVCRCCQHSTFHSEFNEAIERMIISYCLKSRNVECVITQMEERGILPCDLFLSIFIADPSKIDCYIPLNNCIINALIDAGQDIKKMENDELTDCIMKSVMYEFSLSKKNMNRIKKYIEAFFIETYTDADIKNALDSICCDIKSQKLNNINITENTKTTEEIDNAKTSFALDTKDNSSVTNKTDNLSDICFSRTMPKQISDNNINVTVNTPILNDKEKSSSKKNVLVDTKPVIGQQTYIPDIDRDCLDEFGFLKNDITGSKEDIIPIRNNFDEVRYDFLQADIFSIEYAVFHRQDGLLIYLPKCKKYYFCSFNESTKNIIEFITTILSDIHYLKIVMFDIPFLFYLNKNGMYVKNYISIMELYLSAYHNAACTPNQLIGKLIGEKSDLPFPFIVSAMKYYCGIYKKYYSFIDKHCPDNFSSLRLKHYMNKCVAHSLFISDVLPYKKCYITRDLYNKLTFDYHKIKDIIPEKYTTFTVSYENDTINKERISIALKSICSKISTTAMQTTYNAKILNINKKNIVILVPNEHGKIFLSALNHIAIKQGKRYIEPIPQISITSNKLL